MVTLRLLEKKNQVYDILYVHSHCCLKSHDELFHVRVAAFFCVPCQSLGSRTIYNYTQCLIVLQTTVVVDIKLVKHFVHKCYLPLKMYVANYHNDTLWPVYIVVFVYCGSTALALSLTFEVSI